MDFKKVKGKEPDRLSVDMEDPVMLPGVSRIAVVPITVSPSGLACEAELFLGPNDTTKVASSGKNPFTSTGASQSVSLPVTMPSPGGEAYHVYIDVFTAGHRFLAYKAKEDVIVPAGSIGPITW